MIFNAIDLCNNINEHIKKDVTEITTKLGHKPKFVIINASDDSGNARYIENKVKAGTSVGLDVIVRKYDSDCTTNEILSLIRTCKNAQVPVILQKPIYKHLHEYTLDSAITPEIDADCFSSERLGDLINNGISNVLPATPKGVLNLLEYHDVDLVGKVALVIGKSKHVGMPLAIMLMKRGATVLSANSKTADLEGLIMQSDIIVSCVGQTNLFDSTNVKEGAVVIGVGFTYVEGRQFLDFDMMEMDAFSPASLISDRINCTGMATVNALIDNVVELYRENF